MVADDRASLFSCGHATYRKKVGDMVTKRAIVRMLLYCHNLDGIVAKLTDTWKHIATELQVTDGD